jgi:enoyl-CoA hydratase/carnithine racemase
VTAEPQERPGVVLVRQHGSVRWLRLNRPHRRNALDPGLVAALREELDAALADPATAAVVIAGEGPSFCAGADLTHLLRLARTGADPHDFLAAVADCFTQLERAAKPVVAAVHGHVIAGGLELALACDAVVASTGTLIGDGHVRNGLLPAAGASVRLPRKVGDPLARRLMLTGDLLPAEAFQPSGFVHSVVPAGQLDTAATAVARHLATAGPAAVRRIKHLLDRDTDDALAEELATFAEHWRDTDVLGSLHRFTTRGQEV